MKKPNTGNYRRVKGILLIMLVLLKLTTGFSKRDSHLVDRWRRVPAPAGGFLLLLLYPYFFFFSFFFLLYSSYIVVACLLFVCYLFVICLLFVCCLFVICLLLLRFRSEENVEISTFVACYLFVACLKKFFENSVKNFLNFFEDRGKKAVFCLLLVCYLFVATAF